MRVLITGASGFAGGHLARACANAGDDVTGLSRRGELPEGTGKGQSIDLRDAHAVADAVGSARPDVVYHLAALSSVGRSWEDPAETLRDNTATAINVLQAVRREAPDAHVVWASTCEVYGPPEELPIEESARLAPANPYAVSKAAGDLLAGMYADVHGLRIVRARPFNHAGPGQRPIFVLSSLTRQVAEARVARASTLRLVTGNPDSRRDFTDVRDVVRAYRLLAERGEPGIYNVCSGRSVSAAEQVKLLAELASPMVVEHVIDPARMRAQEVMELRGSHDRLTATTGWRPEIALRQTMSDTIAWWQRELALESTASEHLR